jgi:hypothetical protein
MVLRDKGSCLIEDNIHCICRMMRNLLCFLDCFIRAGEDMMVHDNGYEYAG